MTLYKQVVLGTVAVFLILMASVFMVELNTSRQHLDEQRMSELQKTINTVDLVLTPYLKKNDHAALKSAINTLFDKSHYSLIHLTFSNADEALVINNPPLPNKVPKWFTGLNIFDEMRQHHTINRNGVTLAKMEIVNHPGSVYQQLWNDFIHLSFAFACTLIIGILAISLILNRALKPLKLIVSKMEQVAKNQFGQPIPAPKTQDLVHLVEGINRMSNQVEKSFKAQAQEAQQLRENAYIDPVSKLGNHAYYMNQLNAWIGEKGIGGVVLLEATFIKNLYEEQGSRAGDETVQDVASQLMISINTPNAIIARTSAYEFAFIFPNVDETQLEQLIINIKFYINNLNFDPTGMISETLAIGAVYTKGIGSVDTILSELNKALAKAKSNPELDYAFIAVEKSDDIMEESQWRQLVEEAISNDWVTFRFQSATNDQGEIYHNEVFSAIVKDGKTYRASQYLSALEQLNASHLFDQYVIRNLIEKLSTQTLTGRMAINVSPASIKQPSFIRWITNTLASYPQVTSQLHFEIPEISFIQSPSQTVQFCHSVRRAGADFGVDNYGRYFQSLDYLNDFRPTYVKLDYLFTHHLDDDKQTFTLTSISRTAHNLGIVTIASRVETTTQLQFLSQHLIDFCQGFIVDK